MTITIIRPSIIGAALADPNVGWVEGVTAATAVFLLSGIGMLTHIHVNPNLIGDIIPVDVVSDEVIVCGALCASNNELNIFNCSTSSRNPMTWKISQKRAIAYWKLNPPEKRLQQITVKLLENESLVRFHHIMRRIPALTYLKVANIVGNETMKKNANRLVKVTYLLSLFLIICNFKFVYLISPNFFFIINFLKSL